MSRYTLELRYLIEDPNFEIFDFEYEFYNNDLKKQFEEKFKSYFYFREIGQETIGRFKKELKTKLNIIAPMYKQLYESELETKGISWLLNKDLEETFLREIEGNSDNIIKNNQITKTNSENNYKSTFSEYPKTPVDNSKIYATNSTNDNTNTIGDMETTSNNLINGTNKSLESTKLISKGNIGTTSSAELLTAWREVMINIDLMIIEECEELFFQLF